MSRPGFEPGEVIRKAHAHGRVAGQEEARLRIGLAIGYGGWVLVMGPAAGVAMTLAVQLSELFRPTTSLDPPADLPLDLPFQYASSGWGGAWQAWEIGILVRVTLGPNALFRTELTGFRGPTHKQHSFLWPRLWALETVSRDPMREEGGLPVGSPFSLKLGAIPAMDAHQTQSVQNSHSTNLPRMFSRVMASAVGPRIACSSRKGGAGMAGSLACCTAA